MTIFNIFTLLGGLGLFLYGMSVMGSGLEKLSGNHLEKLLENLTSSPLKAVLLGAGITAIIQSSSATTVMVVGFVNSGIMKLASAIVVIMGANVGTTITSWILSLTGIESTNVWIQLLKPSSFSPILAFVGMILYISSDGKKNRKVIGEAILGFAILMFGMEFMSDAVEPLADVPEFTNILLLFKNPLMGVLVGALLTAVIQSSSASVGILQALSLTGCFTYSTVIPIVMGQNIGTTVTAMLSSVGANRNAKRTAFVHLYFNLIGTVLFMVVYYSLNYIFTFSFSNEIVYPIGIAIIHTIFNLVTTFSLLPFTKQLEKLAYLTMPLTEDEVIDQDEIITLDERFLKTPSFALEQANNLTVKMASIVKESFIASMNLIGNYSKSEAERINILEIKVDKYDTRLREFLTKISVQNLTYHDSLVVSVLQHIVMDIERIGDHATNVLKISKKMNKEDSEFSETATTQLKLYREAIEEILDLTVQVLETQDEDIAKSIEALEEVIDNLNKKVKKNHLNRLRKKRCTVELGLYFADIANNFERVADHCSNVAICILQIYDSTIDEHEYTNYLIANEDPIFTKMITSYKERYTL